MRSVDAQQRGVRRRAVRAGDLWVLAGLALTACQGGPVRECRELLAAKSHEAAATRCEGAFEETGDAAAGAAAARAQRALGHGDEVLAWVERLAGTDEEGALWSLAALTHRERGDREGATAAFERALALQRAAGDSRRAAWSLYGLFHLAWEGSEYRQALAFAQRSVLEARKAQDRKKQAKALLGIVTVLYEIGALESAERFLDAARQLDDPQQRARLASYSGLIRLEQQRPALARIALEQALELATGDEDLRFFRSTQLNLVRANLELGELGRAEPHLASAWQHADPDGGNRTALLLHQGRLERRRGHHRDAIQTLRTALDQEPVPEWAWALEYELGLVEEARGEAPAAEAAHERAAGIVEEMRGALGLHDLKAWLLAKKRRPLEALFRLQVAERPRAALASLERARARGLLDALIHATADPEAPSPAAAAERADTLGDLLPALRASPIVALGALDDVLEAVGDRYVLLYFEAGEELWSITVADRRIAARRLAAAVDEVERLIDGFLAHPDAGATAATLGELLLPPGSLPARASTVHVVADGALERLPFAALRRGGRYLVEDYEIVYTPSLNALAHIAERERPTASPPAVLGDPRGDLPGALLEASAVAARLGVAARTGGDAGAGALFDAAGAAVLHLATHTGVGPGGPWLALAGGEVDAQAVLDRQLAPRLVVLASCAAAHRRGLGMWSSLGATFLAAGSRGVLAALWSVEDEPTRRLMLRFYDEGGAVDAPAALARAQRAAIEAGEPPSFWAPFVFLGSSPGRR